MLFTGSYRRNVDEKGRISLPKPLRTLLDGQQLYLAPGVDETLVLLTDTAIGEIGKSLASFGPVEKDARAFGRLFYSRIQAVEPDRQGRLRIPAELSSLTELGSEVMILGVRDRIEVWRAQKWDTYRQAMQANFDELAERVLTNVDQNLGEAYHRPPVNSR